MTDAVLEVENLVVRVRGSSGAAMPVAGVSFSIGRGEIIGLVGESGSGKTLTTLAIGQLLPPSAVVSADNLRFDGKDLQTLTVGRRRALLGTKLAMVFQDPMSSLNPSRRIGPQMTEAVRTHRGLSRKAANALAAERLRQVQIASPERRMRQYPQEFSGGMRQRTMIAMGLMGEPDLIIADEPTTALDVTVQAQVMALMRELNRKRGTALLIVSHNVALLSEVCSRLLVMYAGRIVEDAPVSTIVNNPGHPYTRALIAAVPQVMEDRTRELATIPGTPPDPAEQAVGCPFAPRCPDVLERCWDARPPLEYVSGHGVACWVARRQPAAEASGGA